MYTNLVKQINDSPFKVALAFAGGGQSFAYHFMGFGGASKTIVDIRVPYAREALEEFVGHPVEQFVSEQMAREMAVRSFVTACKSVEPELAVGVGVTCSLATDNEREGRIHRIQIALHCQKYTRTWYKELAQGLLRAEEEEFVCNSVFFALLQLIDSPDKDNNMFFAPRTAERWGGKYDSLDTLNYRLPEQDTMVIMPGSFNPFHEGHNEMANIAKEITGFDPILEITALNADKGALDYVSLRDRLITIPNWKTAVTHARTFLDKARHFARPGKKIIFVVGADTWNRILNPKYAGDTKYLYEQFSELNVQFLPFGRPGVEIEYDEYLSNLVISDDRALNHNNPISSTAIREGRA